MVEPIKKDKAPTHWLELRIRIEHVDPTEVVALAKALEENGRELVEGWTKETAERRAKGVTRATMAHELSASNVFAPMFAAAKKGGG